MPFPVSDTLIEFLKMKLTEEQAEFITIFRHSSLNLEQIKEKTDKSEKEIIEILEDLMKNGVISGNPSRSTGIMVYTLMPPFPGLIEFSLMKGNKGEKERKLANLFDRIFIDLRNGTQRNYDEVMPEFKKFPAPARIIPVEEKVVVGKEEVLLIEEASKIIDQHDKIALAHCYCKQQKDLVGDPCKITDEREICLILGKAANYSINYGFARQISKDEAKKVLKKAEDLGLVHKVFHSNLDFNKGLDGICSCCKCCCGIFRLFYEGVVPYHTLTSYIAETISENCIACGTCVEKCPMEAIKLDDEKAVIDSKRCIGCGVCAHFCPEEAINIVRTGPREVFVLPPRIKIS
ncbi:MAG: 4Fe-4S binding protein [Candidatus Helarchaeota archaeon]